MNYVAKVPGSLMLFGEHAVLHGAWSVVAAVDQYIEISLTPRQDRSLVINSDRLGGYQVELDQLSTEPPFAFILEAIKHFLPDIPTGFNLHIRSDFAHTVGLGSSAAVTVATLRVLHMWLRGFELAPIDLARKGRDIVRQVQGIGSGADIAAASFGGVVAYNAEIFTVKPLIATLPLTVVYSGQKNPTKKVVALVEERRQRYPQLYQQLFTAIDQCAQSAMVAIAEQDWSRVGELMNCHQGLHAALGVSDQQLDDLVYTLRRQSGVYGAKISGSGLGDCVVALGECDQALVGDLVAWEQDGVVVLPVHVA